MRRRRTGRLVSPASAMAGPGRCTPFDTREKAKLGHRSREWTAVGETEEAVIREMARCLREISAGRVPK